MIENCASNESTDLKGMRAVVTGANGFIGRRLVAGLLAANAKVTVLLRSPHDRGYFVAVGADVAICKLTPGPELDAVLNGQTTLFHFAYDVRASGTENLSAFSALLDAAARGGIARVIHASSIVVYDGWPNGKLTEFSPIGTSAGGDYRQAKIAMEAELLKCDMAVAILQPTIVYGPGSALWSDAPQAALRKGPVVLPDPVGICPAVFVDDVVAAALLAAALPDLEQERFIVSGPDTVTWVDFFQGHASLIGVGSVKLAPVDELMTHRPASQQSDRRCGPSAAAQISARLRGVIGSRRFDRIVASCRIHLSGGESNYPPRHVLELFAATPLITSEHARSRLGYRPRFDLRVGLSEIGYPQ